MKTCARLLACAALALVAACGPGHPGTPGADASAPASSGASATAVPPAATQFTPSADGVQIGWRQYGHGEPALVLIHGWAVDSSIWRAQLAALAAHCSVVTVDLAGQGSSGANRQTWSLANFAHDVAAVVARVSNAHIILVGQGMGGPVALEAAPLIGARLQGIVGVETFRTLGLAPPPPSQVDQELQPFRADFAGAVRRFVTATLFHPQTDPAMVRTLADLMAHTDPDRGVAALSELNKLDYASILPGVRTPIVVIDSDLGGAVNEEQLQHAVHGLRLITLNGDDGFPMLDDVARFNATLLQAMNSLAQR